MNGKEPEDVITDLWRNAPAVTASVLGRMSYLSSLWDPASGRYRQSRLAGRLGEAETDRLLRAAHREVFETWLGFNLRQQSADLEVFLSETGPDRRSVALEWSRRAPYRGFPPLEAEEGERLLFLCDLEALTRLLFNRYDAETPPGPCRAEVEPRQMHPSRGLR